MPTLMYGDQGSGLGVKQQAYLDKLMATRVAEKTIFDRFATMQRTLPQKSGKTIKFRKTIPMEDLVLANKLYLEYTQNDVVNLGEGIHHMIEKDFYKNFVLPEGSSGSEFGDFKTIELQTDVFPIGAWMSVTEETNLFHDMYTLANNVEEYSRIAAKIIDGFYRDLYLNSAGHFIDITGNSDPDDKVTSSAFTDAVRKVSLLLRLSGAEYVDEILKSSPNYGTEPVWSRYVGLANPLMAENIKDNPDFVPLEKYASGIKPLDGEIGMLKDIRIVEAFNMYAEQEGSGTGIGYLLVMGKDHTANVPIRGKKRIEVIVKGFNAQDKSDPLNRLQIVGWKSWLGALTIQPERIAVIKARFNY